LSESIVEVENGPCSEARWPNVTSAIRSEDGFVATKAVAAAAASASGLPAIERDVSRASTTFFDRPRLTACRPTTGRPFSSSLGGAAEGTEVTTVARTAG
jgi:hypothetical protein